MGLLWSPCCHAARGSTRCTTTCASPEAVLVMARHAGVVNEASADPTPLSFQHVLLPLDGSQFALAAMPTARAAAARFGAVVNTISVAGDERDADRLRRHAVEALGGTADEDRAHVVVAKDPASVIRDRADELGSCLVCMSTRGRGRVVGTLIGSVARATLLLANRPLIVVGPSADRPGVMVGRPRRRPSSWPEPLSGGGVIACVDGSDTSEAVLPVAAQWAAALRSGLTILTVADEAATAPSGERPNRFGPADPKGYVDDLAARWRNHVPDAAGEVVYDPLEVASGIGARVARQPAALVAVTTHARTGFDRLRLGATAADIVRVSTAPTLVVPLPRP